MQLEDLDAYFRQKYSFSVIQNLFITNLLLHTLSDLPFQGSEGSVRYTRETFFPFADEGNDHLV